MKYGITAALALALAILGGHPETAFFCGATALLWSLHILTEDAAAGRRALLALLLGTLLGAVSLVPFAEYLVHSGAWIARVARSTIDRAFLPRVDTYSLVSSGLSAMCHRSGPTYSRVTSGEGRERSTNATCPSMPLATYTRLPSVETTTPCGPCVGWVPIRSSGGGGRYWPQCVARWNSRRRTCRGSNARRGADPTPRSRHGWSDSR